MLFPYHVNHINLNWCVPLHRGAIEHLSRRFTVVNLDFRGAGDSERSICSLSLDSFRLDIEAVLTELGIDRFALCARGHAALIACRLGAVWSDRVTSIVFIGGGDSEANRRVLRLRHDNPDLEARLRGAMMGGLQDKTNASALAAVAREALGPEALRLWERMLARASLSRLATGVKVPTLWLHASEDKLVSLDQLQRLIGKIDKSKLMVVPGESAMDISRHRPTMSAMTDFLAEGFDVGHALSKTGRQRRKTRNHYPAGLSEREVEVLQWVAAGQTNQQISEALFISLNTVSYHLLGIFNKIGATNRTEVASFAHLHGLGYHHR